MARQDLIKSLLYPQCKSAIEFKFDNLRANPLLSYITMQDIYELNKIATSIRYASKPKLKYKLINDILTARGFVKITSGTNRVVYRYLNDYNIVLKVAIDSVGVSDNGNEFRNQHLLKPFVTKCFEVSPCGTVGLFERVIPITNREEFVHIAPDVFDLINNMIGKYVIEDLGEQYFMNYGLREGFGPVLLDYPYVFELDGRKLICNTEDPLSPKGYCGGEIDYDEGYNNLICSKCGRRYFATELKSEEGSSDRPKIILEGEDIIMKCVLMRGDEVVSTLNSDQEMVTDTIKPRAEFNKLKARLSVDYTEPEKKKENKVMIKTHDDVKLTCRLRGKITGKNVDREAIKQEKEKEAQTEKIVINFNEDPVPVVIHEEPEVVEEPTPVVIESEVVEEPEVETDPGEKEWEHRVIEEPEDFNYNYTEIKRNIEKVVVNDPEPEVVETVTKKDEDAEVVYSDIDTSGNTIGSLISQEILSQIGNYSSEKFTSEIDGYLSSPDVKRKKQLLKQRSSKLEHF